MLKSFASPMVSSSCRSAPADTLNMKLNLFIPRRSDMPSKTATGTIAIQVEDFNDHCPTLTSTTETICHWDNFVYVTAKDEDDFPNSAPYDFALIEEKTEGKWVVEPLNGKFNGSGNVRCSTSGGWMCSTSLFSHPRDHHHPEGAGKTMARHLPSGGGSQRPTGKVMRRCPDHGRGRLYLPRGQQNLCASQRDEFKLLHFGDLAPPPGAAASAA